MQQQSEILSEKTIIWSRHGIDRYKERLEGEKDVENNICVFKDCCMGTIAKIIVKNKHIFIP